MENLQIELVPAVSLRANERNARTHSRRQISQIAASITAFGSTNPVLIDDRSTGSHPEDPNPEDDGDDR